MSLLAATKEAAAHVERARAQADAIVAQARRDADAVIAESRTQSKAATQAAAQALEKARRDGHAQGLVDATTDWTERVVRQAMDSQRSLQRQSERLAHIVSSAVDRVVEHADREALYRRAVRTISKVVKDTAALTLRVPETDGPSAQAAMDSVMQFICADLTIEVVPDASLSEGSCLFESDEGVIDAGLETQLAAIKRAVVRAAQAAAQGDGPDEAQDDLAPDEEGAADAPADEASNADIDAERPEFDADLPDLGQAQDDDDFDATETALGDLVAGDAAPSLAEEDSDWDEERG